MLHHRSRLCSLETINCPREQGNRGNTPNVPSVSPPPLRRLSGTVSYIGCIQNALFNVKKKWRALGSQPCYIVADVDYNITQSGRQHPVSQEYAFLRRYIFSVTLHANLSKTGGPENLRSGEWRMPWNAQFVEHALKPPFQHRVHKVTPLATNTSPLLPAYLDNTLSLTIITIATICNRINMSLTLVLVRL